MLNFDDWRYRLSSLRLADWRTILQPANLRGGINKHPRIAGSILGGAILLVILVAWIGNAAPTRLFASPQFYFVDENTMQRSIHGANDIPPLPGADGKLTVVLAHYWSCTICKDSKLVYLEKYSDAGKKQIEEAMRKTHGLLTPAISIAAQSQMMVAAPQKNPTWVTANSLQGEEIINSFHCPGGNGAIHVCNP